MKNITPSEIIEASQNAPITLNKLSEQFLAIEANFNSVVNNFNNQKSAIETNSANTLNFTLSQHKQQVADEQKNWENGTYVSQVVKENIEKWEGSIASNKALIWVVIILGVVVLFAASWWVGILIGGLGFMIFNSIVVSTEDKVSRTRNIASNNKTIFNLNERNSLRDISNELGEAINSESEYIENKIESLKDSLASEYNEQEFKELIERDQKLNELEDETQKIMAELRAKTTIDIQKVNSTLHNLVSLLNQLPESFDSNSINWNSDKVFKGKESVATNFRVGVDKLQINIEGKNHSIDVPRCLQFLNKSNLVFNCNNQAEIKEAIRVSHNIIARTLLSLPASKTKITFIDPLELGGNAAPFTPLLREIYGGMVFTQQNDIEIQLALLTRAIENVIQKYLQDKFTDIADYNKQNEQVPEPYRLLIVYNFPHGFNDTTAIKLLNIIKSGPKAGVHTILLNDKCAKLPYGMDWQMFNSVNIQPVELSNILESKSTLESKEREVDNMKPTLGNVYEGRITQLKEFGAFVEFLPGIEGLVHISQVSNESLESLDGILSVGDKVKIKIIDVDRKTGKFKLSIKDAPEDKEDDKENTNLINTQKSTLYKNSSLMFEFDKNLQYSEIVDYINKELPNVSSIKVPFTKYIAPQNEWWQEKAHKSFAVPIGRHALEVQNLKFDNDDDNQALLIGKPGSGKSNLLHVIIANSIWKYSPDQLEIYLIDFKGGVEFTVYADKKIPHIRTIAIESEREFGLSVLDGVEKELLRREMEFSKTGVQNIEQYHDKFPNERMPRVMLIVDEFQEFYAEDDNIKQSVDDKFDRIVRKGRAFGINTLFSSQTLSGNSIKKSTKELIDIRIALMCSDLDSNQILDDRNPAARDLTRPGEGIYNPENGKVEGNRKFQAFFIDKEDLTKTIESVVAFSNANGNGNKSFKQIIFRGSEKALMEKDNHPLKKIIASANPKSLRLWVGEPVAIAEDVTAVLRKQGGSNLLVAGYDESIGLRVMCSSIISIAVQQQPNTCKFYSFNFYNVDSEFVNVPDELFNSIDQDCVVVNSRQVSESLLSIKEEIEKRLAGSSTNSLNIYLTFFSLQRGRAFRKDGYSMSDEGNVLAYILKEGADVGVYSLVQFDTMDNFAKNLDDTLLKEFSQRVASQMNPDNSVKVIGNQKAAKLGSNRAWYYDDNENTMIKFKPYELPTFTWVAQLQKPQSSLS